MLDKSLQNIQITAKVIKDSEFNNTRLITLECVYPKFIQAEINTHRQLVKNASSHRAVPYDTLKEFLYIPEAVGINKSGMRADEYLAEDTLKEFKEEWTNLYLNISQKASELKDKYKVHKQLINRVIEPFTLTKGILTGTMETWEHIFNLRIHKDAQPEFCDLMIKAKEVINQSVPQQLKIGEYHLPYVDSVEAGVDDVNIKISASCIAQVSYRKLDDTPEKALDIFNKLNLLSTDKNNPPHISPVQHICTALNYYDIYNTGLVSKDCKKYFTEMGDSFIQVSKIIENENMLSIPYNE